MNDSHTEEAAPSAHSAAVSPPTPPGPLAALRDRIKRWQAALAVLEAAQSKLTPEILAKVRLFGDQIDFDNLTRPEVTAVLLALGGTWAKSVNACRASMDYVTTIGGINFRLWAAEPPPSCRIVKREVVVAEHVVPEHVETVTEIVCQEAANA